MTDIETPPQRKPAKTVEVDWWEHPPVWVTFNVAFCLAWATWAAHKLDVPPMVALVAGAIGLLGAVAAAMIAEKDGNVIWWRVACWALPSVWATAAIEWSPWQPYVLGTGLALAVVLGLVAYSIRHQQKTDEEKAAEKAAKGTGLTSQELAVAPADAVWNASDPSKTSREALAGNWEPRIRRVTGIKGAHVIDVGMWSQGTGYTLRVKLPRGGASWKDLADYAEGLAEDAELPVDCGITVKGGPRRGLADMQVTHVNKMAETHLAPADYSPTSIYHPARVGILPDGAFLKVALKWVWMALTGQTDSGKSSMLHLLNLYLFRCTDTVVWHIDVGGGGGISRPWAAPWFEERATHPNVDWVAATNAEAELMCRAAVAIIQGRKRHYRDRLDNGKLVCTPEVPHIVIVSDETANLPERVKELLTEACQTGRAAGVRGITCALRAVADDLPRDIRQHSRARIGMRVSDADEIRYLFDSAGKVDPELAPHQGSGWVEHQDEDGDGKPVGKKYLTPFKAFFLPDARIDEAASAVAPLRPALDPASAALADKVTAGGRAYTDRWERTLGDLFVVDDPAEETPADPERARRIAEAEARQEQEYQTGATVDERMSELARLKDEILADTEGVDDVDLGAFTGIVDNLGDVLAAVDTAGPEGIGPAEILRRVNAPRDAQHQITGKTVQRQLNELLKSNAVTRLDRGVYVSALHQGGTDGH